MMVVAMHGGDDDGCDNGYNNGGCDGIHGGCDDTWWL